MTRPKLSVAMMVRNEARFLPACLAAVKGKVDEVVILDTGSTDDTVKIARDFGARVVEEPERRVELAPGLWSIDDFGACRNRSFSLCEGEWILSLDADYVVTPQSWRHIYGLIERQPNACAASLWFHNARTLKARPGDVVSGKRREGKPFALTALFRNTDAPWYEGVIHESPAAWMARQKAAGFETYDLPGVNVVHYGYVGEHFASANKGLRNLLLLQRAVDKDPSNPIPLSYLALIYAEHDPATVHSEESGEYQKHLGTTPVESLQRAAEIINRAWRMRGDKRLEGLHLLRLCVARCKVGFRMAQTGVTLQSGEGGPEVMWETARVWDREGPMEHPDMLLFKGLACECMADLERQSGRTADATAHLAAARVFYARSLEVPYGSMRFVTSETAEERLRVTAPEAA